MSSLVERLYPLPDYRRTPLSLLRWWESRRLLYNGIVGATGTLTLVGIWVITSLPPLDGPLPLHAALIGAAAYGVMANVFYSLGWGVEVLASRLWGRRAPDLGPVLFRQGVIFSVGLTLLPLFLVAFIWFAHLVLWVVAA